MKNSSNDFGSTNRITQQRNDTIRKLMVNMWEKRQTPYYPGDDDHNSIGRTKTVIRDYMVNNCADN